MTTRRQRSAPPLPSRYDARYVLNNVTSADAYSNANTLLAPGSRRLRMDVFTAAIYYQLGIGWPNPTWGAETFFAPARAGLNYTFDAIRIRSAVAGVPAQVTIEAKP